MNQVNPEVIVNYMTDKIKTLRKPGTVFPLMHLSQTLNLQPQIVEQMLESLQNQNKVHRVGRENWGLGGNPWAGQRRQKIFNCQHCGKPNTVDITGD
jgi:hypothetical protein